MLELQDRIDQYLQMNDLEKIFQYLQQHRIPYDQVDYNNPFFQNEIRPEQGETLEQTMRKYRAFVSAAADNRYIPSEFYIPDGRNMYIRKYPRYMEEHTHYHKDILELDIVLQGEFSQELDGQQIRLRPGDLLLIAPNIRHTARIYSDTGVVFTVMIYQKVIRDLMNSVDSEDNILRKFLLRILYSSSCWPYLLCRTGFDVDLAGLIIDLEENQEQYGPHVNSYMEAGLRLFLLRMLVRHETQIQTGREVTKNDSDILNIMDYIETNFKTITLSALAESYSYSPNYLSGLIRKQYGKTFHDILTEVKMKKAADLLTTTDLTMSRIAEQTGFSDKSYFLKCFKKHFGMTPLEYKNLPKIL